MFFFSKTFYLLYVRLCLFKNVFEEMSANADSYIHSAEQQFSNTNQRSHLTNNY